MHLSMLADVRFGEKKMKAVTKIVLLISFVLVIVSLAAAATGLSERVSVSSAEEQADHMSGRRGRPELSADGRFVVFDSLAANLVSNDSNVVDDIFVRDRVNDTTERVSVSSGGDQANDLSTRPAISGDGNLIAFQSEATNLVADDTNGASDVFVHDRTSGQTTRVSVASDGTQGDAVSFLADISADGRYVVFSSDATNLVANKTTIYRDIYVHDRLTGTTERANLSSTGEEANSNSFVGHISGDGRFVTFNSIASNLVPDDTNGGLTDIFIRDLVNGTTERVSVSSDEAEADGISNAAFPSFDGRYVVFSSDATNLVADDTNGTTDIFVRDREKGTTERVSVSSDETESNGSSDGPGVRGGTSFGPDISADGRFVTFDSIATNLVPDDTNTCEAPAVPPFDDPGLCPDIFVRDRLGGTTERVSVSGEGAQSNHASTDPAISPNGNVVAFFTLASNLAPGDTNTCAIPPIIIFDDLGECPDIYVHEGIGAPIPTYGVNTSTADADLSGAASTVVTYTVEIQNTSDVTDSYDLSVSGNSWTTQLDPLSVTVGPAASETVWVTVHIPAEAAAGETDIVTVTAASAQAADSVVLTTTAEVAGYTIYLPMVISHND
jgi:hypothetical protein